jgi:AcrR family transcriptional regulator
MQVMKQPSRKERELALRQAIIFEAAEAVLAERGYHGASVDEIARRAEISVGTLYNLFGNKENLFASVTERSIEILRAAVRERADAVAGGADKLHAAVDAIFAYFDEHEKSFRVWVTATHGLDWNVLPQFGERVFAQMRGFTEDITSLCRRAVREGTLPRLDPEFLSLSLLGTINSFVTHWVTERKGKLSLYRQGVHGIVDAWTAGAAARRETGRKSA